MVGSLDILATLLFVFPKTRFTEMISVLIFLCYFFNTLTTDIHRVYALISRVKICLKYSVASWSVAP